MSEISLNKLSHALEAACTKTQEITNVKGKDTPENQKKLVQLVKSLVKVIPGSNEDLTKEINRELRLKGTRTTMNQILSILKSHAFLSRVLQEQVGIVQASLLTDQETKEFEKFQKNIARIAKELREAGKRIQGTIGKGMLTDYRDREEK